MPPPLKRRRGIPCRRNGEADGIAHYGVLVLWLAPVAALSDGDAPDPAWLRVDDGVIVDSGQDDGWVDAWEKPREGDPDDRLIALAPATDVDVAMLRDVVERHGVSNVTGLRWLVRHLLGNAASRFSVEKLYAARPDAVRRAIVSPSASAAAAFADAFRLRKD